jgi:hypothetical protein
MSGDHNQNQSDSGWRKRQIALDIKAENARELGLDYEPQLDQGADYERGFVDGMQKQMQSSVDKAVNRMAQPEQEPVAWNEADELQCPICKITGRPYPKCGCINYTTPPQRTWVGLTEEEIKAFDTWHDNREEEIGWVNPSEIVAYLEAKLKEKNFD